MADAKVNRLRLREHKSLLHILNKVSVYYFMETKNSELSGMRASGNGTMLKMEVIRIGEGILIPPRCRGEQGDMCDTAIFPDYLTTSPAELNIWSERQQTKLFI